MQAACTDHQYACLQNALVRKRKGTSTVKVDATALENLLADHEALWKKVRKEEKNA